MSATMLGNGGSYAVKRRKKPVPKSAKPPPVKTNPSKRHRDRLNAELDHLTSLLPFSEEVRGHLDKLSVLRLSVGFLKVKSYFQVALQKSASPGPPCANDTNGQPASLDGVRFSEGQFLLQALNGFVLVVTADGTIFYTSPTIQDFLGYNQFDVVHQSVYELVHMDDREMFKSQLHFALDPSITDVHGACGDASDTSQRLQPQHIPPENSSFLERSFCCRLRCLLDNTSGFLALNLKGRLKYLRLHGNDSADENAAPPQLALFAVATPVQPPSVMEIRTKTLLFQTKHRMDFAPMGIDPRGRLVLGYTETELVTTGSGYQFIHAADMMHCADNHLRMIKTGDSGFTIFRLLTKTRRWLWVQASARVVFKGGRPDFIIARQKALTNEEGEEHLRRRTQQLPFNLATGEGVLYDFSLDPFSITGFPGSGVPSTAEPTTVKTPDPGSLLECIRRQDPSVYVQPQEPGPQHQTFSQVEDPDFDPPQSSLEQVFLESHALLSVPGQIQTSREGSVTGGLKSEAMIESLEQILKDLRHEDLEGLKVEETELRDWENTLVRVNKERDETSVELNHILANDVFSYVEEALRTEFGGFVQGPDQPLVLEAANGLSIRGRHAEQTLWASVGSGSTEPRGSHRANTPHGHTSSFWSPSSSNHECGNQIISPQPCKRPRSRTSSVQTPNSVCSTQPGSEAMDTDSEWTPTGRELPEQQLSPCFHCHSPASFSHTAACKQSPDPLMQRLGSSCMDEKRQAHKPNTPRVPSRHTGAVRGPARSRDLAHVTRTGTNSPPFTPTHADMAACIQTGTDRGDISLGQLNEENAGLEATLLDWTPENGSLQSVFFDWNSEAQSLTTGLSTQSINVSQKSGP